MPYGNTALPPRPTQGVRDYLPHAVGEGEWDHAPGLASLAVLLRKIKQTEQWHSCCE